MRRPQRHQKGSCVHNDHKSGPRKTIRLNARNIANDRKRKTPKRRTAQSFVLGDVFTVVPMRRASIVFPIVTLRETIDYDPLTGLFRSVEWSIYGPTGDGYKLMRHKPSNTYLAQHRAAYAFMTGYWPQVVDHINRDKTDNRWMNLRGCTHRGNCRNMVSATSRLSVLAQKRQSKRRQTITP